MKQGKISSATGLPVLRALILLHLGDPACWSVDDEYHLGDAFQVAPVMNSEGARDAHLPAGQWVDFWTSASPAGARWLK